MTDHILFRFHIEHADLISVGQVGYNFLVLAASLDEAQAKATTLLRDPLDRIHRVEVVVSYQAGRAA
jgi:hypothetical protein